MGPVLVLPLVVGRVRVEVDSARRRQHTGGHVFHVIRAGLLSHSEAVMLGDIPVGGFILGDGESDSRAGQPIGFVGARFREHDKENLSRGQLTKPSFAGNNFALWRIDTAYPDQVKLGDPGVAKGLLKRLEVLPMLAVALGKEHLFGDKWFIQSLALRLLLTQLLSKDRRL